MMTASVGVWCNAISGEETCLCWAEKILFSLIFWKSIINDYKFEEKEYTLADTYISNKQ